MTVNRCNYQLTREDTKSEDCWLTVGELLLSGKYNQPEKKQSSNKTHCKTEDKFQPLTLKPMSSSCFNDRVIQALESLAGLGAYATQIINKAKKVRH